MPNECSNLLIITGRVADVAHFVAVARGQRAPLALEAIDPSPYENGSDDRRLLSWRGRHWGTRDYFDWTIDAESTPGMIRYRLESASTPPTGCVRRASGRFATLCFALHFAEEGWGRAGSIVCAGGKVLASMEVRNAAMAHAYQIAYFGLNQATVERLDDVPLLRAGVRRRSE